MGRCISLISLILLLTAMPAMCQETVDHTREATWQVGAGGLRQQDTYLSPLQYSGWQVSFLRESLHMTHYAGERLSFHTLLQGAFSQTTPQVAAGRYWGGRIGFDCGWHYNWYPVKGLRLLAGGLVGTDVGFLYNTRNGNNPAQARFNLDLSASVMGIYDFRIRRQTLSLRYEADMPFIGMMFSPQYGQSYYEIGEGRTDHNICLAHPANAFSLWQKLSVDIPVGKVKLRFSYLCDIRQSQVNGIKVHDWGHSFMIGFVRRFNIVR